MLDFASRVVYAIGYDASASTGSRKLGLLGSQTGNHESLMQNTRSRSVANTKLGTAVKSVEKKTMSRSGHLLRMSAARLPNTVPHTSATPIAMRPSFAEIGKDSEMISLMSRPFFSDTPKSPCRRFFMYKMNCSPTGLSRL